MYAILYAVLVVVLVGMSAIVVDIAGLREDRRDNRAAADSAATGGAEFLNPISFGGVRPKEGCEQAWAYLSSILDDLPTPSTPCSDFNGVTATTYCSTAAPAMIRAQRTVGDRTVVIAWPVPRDDPATAADESQGYLNSDVAPNPGGVVNQDFASERDGSDAGCDRIGVAIIEDRTFGLANGIGSGGQNTSIHSVARFNPDGGEADQIAALNVLNPTDCASLVTTGGGKVLVGPTVENGVIAGPGIIAVESTGLGTCVGSPNPDGTGGGNRVIDPNRTSGGSLVCASNVILNSTGSNCDGLGLIQSYAYGLFGNPPRAFNPSAVPTNLKPRPVAKNIRQRWNPVTKLFGCTSALNPCLTPPSPQPNYIQTLVTALGGTGLPTSNYPSSQAPYVDPYPGAFAPVPAGVCVGGSGITGTVVVPAGNWYANCSINIANGGVLIIKGGTLVVEGGIILSGGSGQGGCFVMNTDVSACPTAASIVDKGTPLATTTPKPAHDAIIYLRGNGCGSACGLDHQGTLVWPQTFMYAAPNAREVSVNSTKLTVWTAPGAGAIDPVTKRSQLEQDCWDSAAAEIDRDCMNSRFSRLDYWSAFAAPKTKANTFNGQGSLDVVGVFFTPLAYFNFTGGGTYTASFAQFWSDQLNVDGGAFLGLAPDIKTSIETPSGAVDLIR